MLSPEETYSLALARKADNRTFIKKLARIDRNKLDNLVHEVHEKVFEQTNCLECGNCCKSLGPRITDADVGRIASALKIKPAQLVSDLLYRDEDGDLVFNSMPCPFLDAENYCSIYQTRPLACRDYPHTDRRRFYQVLEITLKNSFTCPAVLQILEKLKLKI